MNSELFEYDDGTPVDLNKRYTERFTNSLVTEFPKIPKKTGTKSKQAATGTIITTGGYLAEQEKNYQFTSVNKWRTFRDIRYHTPVVAASMDHIRDFVGSADMQLIPKFFEQGTSEAEKAEEVKKEMEEILFMNGCNYHEALQHICNYFFYGFALLEWMRSTMKNGKFYLESLDVVDAATIERWDIEKGTGRIKGWVQRDPNVENHEQYRYLNRKKFLYSVYPTPDGRADGQGGKLREVAYHALMLYDYERKQGVGYERELSGIPYIYAPLQQRAQYYIDNFEMDPQQARLCAENEYEFLFQYVQNLKKSNRDSAVIMDSQPWFSTGEDMRPSTLRAVEVGLLDGPKGPHHEMLATISSIERMIARVFGTEAILLGDSSAGSYSLASEQMSSFRVIVESIMKQIESVLSEDLIKPFAKLNGIDMEFLPRFSLEMPKEIQPKEQAEILKTLSENRGLTPFNDTVAENAIRTNAGIELLPENSQDVIDEEKQKEEDFKNKEMELRNKPKPAPVGKGVIIPNPWGNDMVRPYVYAKPHSHWVDWIKNNIQKKIVKGSNGVIDKKSAVPDDELHATIMYSQSEVLKSDAMLIYNNKLIFDMNVGKLELFNNDERKEIYVVLRIDDQIINEDYEELEGYGLRTRHEAWKSIGSEWAFPEYNPHITVFKRVEEYSETSYTRLKGQVQDIIDTFNSGFVDGQKIFLMGEYFKDKKENPSDDGKL